jgi:small GTP-binding protein
MKWIFKVVIGGDGGVGKTALIEKYVIGTFKEDHKMTIGAAFSVKDVQLDSGEIVRLQLWDFAGEKRFRYLLPDYCRGASGAILCYDITDYATFEHIKEWLEMVRSKVPKIPVILVGTKFDLEKHEVDEKVAEDYAKAANCIGNAMCSAKLNLNVDAVFDALAKWLIFYALQEENEQ